MNNKIQIPKINRDGNLLSRLIPMVLVGADKKFDRESKLYLYLFVRLVDKSFNEENIYKKKSKPKISLLIDLQ